MALDLFRNSHVRHLLVGVPQNLQRYKEKKAWAHREDGFRNARLPCSLEPAVPLELEMPEAGDLKDRDGTHVSAACFTSPSRYWPHAARSAAKAAGSKSNCGKGSGSQ